MTEQRECYVTTDAQLTTVEVPPAPDAEVVMLRSELEELRGQLAAAEERLETLRQNYAAEVVERGNTERALAEARAALAELLATHRPSHTHYDGDDGGEEHPCECAVCQRAQAIAAGQPAQEGDR